MRPTLGDSVGNLVIIGAGGQGREILGIVDSINDAGGSVNFLGFLDDGNVDLEMLARIGAVVLGPSATAGELDARYVIGVGAGALREQIDQRLGGRDSGAMTLVHPDATVGRDVRIGRGSTIQCGCSVTTNISLGRCVELSANVAVGHDSMLDDYCSAYPGATISGNVTIGRAATLGTGANVLPGVTIGAYAYVGAGAVVTRDVEPGSVVAGNPARVLRPTA